MINNFFGNEVETIEVCSGKVWKAVLTVDINLGANVDMVADAQELSKIPFNTFERWCADPPYNRKTAREIYNCELPSLSKLLTEGARVIKPGSLIFLLCSQNYQICPSNVKRIGLIYISLVPNNETRILNIYVKLPEEKQEIPRNEQ